MWGHTMDLAGAMLFICSKHLAVIATINLTGRPEAALIGFAFDPAFGLVFDTSGISRKARNLRRHPEAAVVIGWDEETTLQLEGVASEPQGKDLRRAKELYFSIWQDGRGREMWPDITYFLIKPQWLRYTEYGGTSEVSEFIGPF